MRHAIIVIALACATVLYQGWLGPACEQVTTAGLSDEARLAIDVRCRGRDDRGGEECRQRLKRLYLSGALDPDKTIRAWCASVKTAGWGGTRPTPPRVCVERYGGWPTG